MCFLARTNVTRGTLAFFCRDTISFFLVIKNIYENVNFNYNQCCKTLKYWIMQSLECTRGTHIEIEIKSF